MQQENLTASKLVPTLKRQVQLWSCSKASSPPTEQSTFTGFSSVRTLGQFLYHLGKPDGFQISTNLETVRFPCQTLYKTLYIEYNNYSTL
jgi:hypothetical protein